MKKKILLTVIISVLLIFSCNKTDESKDTDAAAADKSGHSETGTAHEINQSTPGYSLFITTGFYKLSGEDTGNEATKVEWAARLALGERVMAGESRQMINKGDNKLYNFIEVRRDTGNGFQDGYALQWQIAVGGQLAVVAEENTSLYRTPRIVDVTGTVLSRKTVVVYYPETQREGFVEVRGYDFDRKEYVSASICNIQFNKLSRDDADIQSAILLHTANGLTTDADKARKTALLNSAIDTYPESIFYREIWQVLNPDSVFSGNVTSSSDDDWWY